MMICLLYHNSERQPSRYYRIELAMNLFSEVSVLREWGIAGCDGRCMINIYGNLRDASLAADEHRMRMIDKGYFRDTWEVEHSPPTECRDIDPQNDPR